MVFDCSSSIVQLCRRDSILYGENGRMGEPRAYSIETNGDTWPNEEN
jgi:hypothetical protein